MTKRGEKREEGEEEERGGRRKGGKGRRVLKKDSPTLKMLQLQASTAAHPGCKQATWQGKASRTA
jgi:hypothetical protein